MFIIPIHDMCTRVCLLHLDELLALITLELRNNIDDVETNGFGQGPALADGNVVSFVDTEAGRDVRGSIGVSLLETVVLFDVVQVIATDDEGAVHLVALDSALKIVLVCVAGRGGVWVCAKATLMYY